MTGRIRIEHRWAAGLALSFIMAAAPGHVFSQKARSEVAPIAIPHSGKPGGAAGQKEARKALEKSVRDRKQGEKITEAETIVWKSKDRPADSTIRKSMVAALRKQGYSYEVLYDGTANDDNGQGAIYFQATPEEDGETIVGMWLGFSDDEYKLVWTSLTGGPGNDKADEATGKSNEASGKNDDGNAELAEALYKKGLKALADDRGEDAAKAFKNALELNPDHKGAAKALQALDSSAASASTTPSGAAPSGATSSEAKTGSDRKEASKSEPAEKSADDAAAEKPAASSGQDSVTTGTATTGATTSSSPESGKDKAATDALRRLFGK